MNISLVMCTRNRAEALRRVLESASAMRIPSGLEWEFVLVDNGSTDETAAVVDSFANHLPIRRVVEPKAGLSNARNKGVAEARGEYICWTDDDVLIDPEWLAAYAQAFNQHPEAAFFGGVIEPVLEGETPKWFQEARPLLGDLLAERDLGPLPSQLTVEGNCLPYGANYAVRRKEQEVHLYNPNLGVSPDKRRLGEEMAVLRAVAASGSIGFWVPTAKVLHLIPASRQTIAYLIAYQRAAGETWAYLEKEGDENLMGIGPQASDRRFMNVPLWVWRRLMEHGLAFAAMRIFASADRWVTHLQHHSYFRGAVDFWWRERSKRLNFPAKYTSSPR